MSIQVRQMLVSKSKYPIKCPYYMIAEFVTYHETANDASANNEVSYMNNNNSSTGYHFAVDDEEVVQGIPLDRNAFHCGDGVNGTGNRKSIGVEVCYSRSGGTRYKKAESLAIRFIAQLLHERNWGVDRVRQHFNWSGKNCPHRARGEGRWDQIVNSIQTELNKLNNPNIAKSNIEGDDIDMTVAKLTDGQERMKNRLVNAGFIAEDYEIKAYEIPLLSIIDAQSRKFSDAFQAQQEQLDTLKTLSPPARLSEGRERMRQRLIKEGLIASDYVIRNSDVAILSMLDNMLKK